MGDWNEVGGGGKIVKLGEEEGQIAEVEGVFKGVRTGEFGPLYDLGQPDGSTLTLAHNSAIGFKLDDYAKLYGGLPVGKEVKFRYCGMRTPKKGGKPYKDIAFAWRDPATTGPAAEGDAEDDLLPF